MTPGQVTTLVVGLMILVGGPLYLIGKVMERHTARKAKAWSASPAGMKQHTNVALSRVDSLGPLNQKEHDALLFNILFVTSFEGSITWEGIIAQTAGARQVARNYPRGLPWLTDPDAGSTKCGPSANNPPAIPADGHGSEASAGEHEAPIGPRH